MSEANLVSLFIDKLPQFNWDRVESHAASPGIPDTHYIKDGVEDWIEFKYAAKWSDVAKGIKKLRPNQANWLVRHTNAKGRAWIVLRVEDQILFFHGSIARELRIPKKPLHKYATAVFLGPRFSNWDDIARLMTSTPKERLTKEETCRL